mmetsp:Transcript_58673/g.105590  ORF Transcript_58673/g.105590 Transcript_58673/m.105590 type:complete len:80 (-) Transcript_58673:186-425(-)
MTTYGIGHMCTGPHVVRPCERNQSCYWRWFKSDVPALGAELLAQSLLPLPSLIGCTQLPKRHVTNGSPKRMCESVLLSA